MILAKATGEPVEIASERDEYAEAYAMPDGLVRMNLTVSPAWARGADRAWHRPDATLEKKPDGSIGPRFDVAGTRFSAGGVGPMARLSRAGATVSFGWPGGVLPVPVVAGTQATYSEVWPGVDLVLDAAADGFRPVLVVKTAEAARLPQLQSVAFPVSTSRVTLRASSTGGFEFTDAAGSVVFSGPAGAMWDSAGDATARSTGPAGESHVPGRSAQAGGDRARKVPAAVSARALTISADRSWLTSPERVFPVFVDPVTGAGTPTYTMVSSGGWEAWKFSGDEGVGKCGTWNGYYCGDGFVKRIFFQFSKAQADALAGKEVMDATFRAYETWSFQCANRTVNLYRTSAAISSSTTWPGPGATDLLGDRSVSAGRGDLCSPSQPDAWIDFNDSSAETDENLTATVRSWVAGSSDLTLRLSAADETDTAAHKRFQGSSASLQVYYRPVPAVPTSFGVQTGTTTTTSCGTSTNPTLVDTSTARFRGTVQAVKDNDPAYSLRLRVGYAANNADGTWSGENLTTSTTDVKDDTSVAIDKPATPGYFYRVRAWTGSTYSGAATAYSGATGYCYFLNDTTAPVAPSLAVATPYSECTTNQCAPGGAPGTAATFTVTTSEMYITKATWALRDINHENPPLAVGTITMSGGQGTISVTPGVDGDNHLEVYLTDQWGRNSPAKPFTFRVDL